MDSQQIALFHEDIYSALATDVAASGGPKKIGAMLWPELSPDKAGERLNACLNRDRREVLNPEQVQLIKRVAKEHGSYAAVFQESDATGFSRPTPIEPEDEKAMLQRQFIESQKLMSALLVRMEQIQHD